MEGLFVRNHLKSPLDDADTCQFDVLAVEGGKFALFAFAFDGVGTQVEDPQGSACGISTGSLGRIGGLMTVEKTENNGKNAPIAAGPNAGLLKVVANDSAEISESSFNGRFESIGGRRLPASFREYADIAKQMQPELRLRFPF
jgi:hypothetical protein